MLMSFDLDAGRSSATASTTWPSRTSITNASRSSICADGQKQITFDKVPLEQATEYAGEDADIALRLWHRLKPRLAAENADAGLRAGRPASGPGHRADGAAGIKVDRDYLAKLSSEFSRRSRSSRPRSTRRPCGPFTIGSPQQLGEVLYDGSA